MIYLLQREKISTLADVSAYSAFVMLLLKPERPVSCGLMDQHAAL